MSKAGKRAAVVFRAREQAKACREGFRAYGDQYAQPVLFIAGLPKSGSTWIERMVASYPGYHEYLMPEVASHEIATGGSHDFELPEDMFDRFQDMLVLTKMHVHGSPNNVRVLRDAGVNYVVLQRDLRDVAVSYHFYVQNTPWHPEHAFHIGKSVAEGLAIFADRMLPAYAAWIRSWRDNADPDHSLQVRYEDMLCDPIQGMAAIANLFELPADLATIKRVVEANNFKRMSGGRDRGEDSAAAFARKGVAGDWVNHFTPQLRESYGGAIADLLIETGDEQDDAWVTSA
jgi:hypothetical protein